MKQPKKNEFHEALISLDLDNKSMTYENELILKKKLLELFEKFEQEKCTKEDANLINKLLYDDNHHQKLIDILSNLKNSRVTDALCLLIKEKIEKKEELKLTEKIHKKQIELITLESLLKEKYNTELNIKYDITLVLDEVVDALEEELETLEEIHDNIDDVYYNDNEHYGDILKKYKTHTWVIAKMNESKANETFMEDFENELYFMLTKIEKKLEAE